MKRLLSFVPFVIACCLLIGDIVWGTLIIVDTCREVERLAGLPGASGVDYLGVHLAPVLFGVGVFIPSVGGMILSGVSRAVVKNGKFHTASGVLMIRVGVLLLVSVVACMWRWF